MKSVRLDERQQERLARAASQCGVTQSEFIRRAIDKACDETLPAESLYDRIKDVIGIGHLGGGVADRTGEAFTELVAAKHAREVDDFERSRKKTRRRRTA